MDYTTLMLKLISMPRKINVRGKSVSPEVLFSPVFCESMLYWQASSISSRLHGEVALDIRVVADKDKVSGSKLVSLSDDFNLTEDGKGLGLAAGLMLVSAAADQIIAPARKHASFDYANLILGFREIVGKNYDKGQILLPEDYQLNTFFYDNIVVQNRMDSTPVEKPRQRVVI